MKEKKKRIMGVCLTLILVLAAVVSCGKIDAAAAGDVYGEMKVHYKVYDASTDMIHQLGTVRIVSRWEEEKGGWYGQLWIPELSEVIPFGATYGVLQKVTGSWCDPIGDGSSGDWVRFLANEKNAEVMYWVNYYDPDGRESVKEEGSDTTLEKSIAYGDATKWDQVIVFHSNFPNGKDVTCTVTYHVSTYRKGSNICVLGDMLKFRECGFGVQRGYRLRDSVWNASPDGTGESYSGVAYWYLPQDSRKKTHIYATYKPLELSDEIFYRITYREMDGSKEFGVSSVLKEQQMTAGIVYKEKCMLRGWSRVPNDNRVMYEAGESFVPEEDMTLYAVWDRTQPMLPEESEPEPEESEPEPEESEPEPEESETEPEESEPEPEESEPEPEESEPEESEPEPEESEPEPEESETEPEESETEPEESEPEPEESETEPEESEPEPEESEPEPEESETEPEESEPEPEESEPEPEESETEPEESETEPKESEPEPEESESEPEESEPEPEESEPEPEESEPEPEESEPEPEESEPEPEESETEPEESEPEPEESEPEPEESETEPEESETEPEESEPEPEESEPEPKRAEPDEPDATVPQVQDDSPVTGESDPVLCFPGILFLFCALLCHIKGLQKNEVKDNPNIIIAFLKIISVIFEEIRQSKFQRNS